MSRNRVEARERALAVMRRLESRGLVWREEGRDIVFSRDGAFAILLEYFGEGREDWLRERFFWGDGGEFKREWSRLSSWSDFGQVLTPWGFGQWLQTAELTYPGEEGLPESWDVDPAEWRLSHV